jgi:hypothetical protein
MNVDLPLETAPVLCHPYIERLAREELADETLEICLISRREVPKTRRRQEAIDTLGLKEKVFSRADGRPMVAGGGFLGLSHTGNTTLAIRGAFPIACDATGLNAGYPKRGGSQITAEEWAEAEVLRKLGLPGSFSSASTRGSGAALVFTCSIATLGLAISIGRRT